MIRQKIFGEEPTDPPVVIDCHHPSFVTRFFPGKLSTLPKLDFSQQRERERKIHVHGLDGLGDDGALEVFVLGVGEFKFKISFTIGIDRANCPSVHLSVHRPPTACKIATTMASITYCAD